MDTNRVRERLLTTWRVASKLLLRLERQFHTIGNAWSIGILEAVPPDPLRLLLPTLNTMTVGSRMERGRDRSFQNVSTLPTAGNCIQTREELGGVLELYMTCIVAPRVRYSWAQSAPRWNGGPEGSRQGLVQISKILYQRYSYHKFYSSPSKIDHSVCLQ